MDIWCIEWPSEGQKKEKSRASSSRSETKIVTACLWLWFTLPKTFYKKNDLCYSISGKSRTLIRNWYFSKIIFLPKDGLPFSLLNAYQKLFLILLNETSNCTFSAAYHVLPFAN